MYNLEELLRLIMETISNNQANGQGSILTIQISPYGAKEKNPKTKTQKITSNDVLDAHEALQKFDGDFKKLWNKSA